jgi:hypothetical protein
MDIDHWEAMKDGLRRKFEVEEEGDEELIMDTRDGEVLKGSANFLIFTTPIGRVKLSFEKKPMVLGKTEHFSHRAGEAPRTDYEFSDSEFSYKLKAYKWNDIDETWNPIDAENFR